MQQVLKFPRAHSMQDSVAILDKYKQFLTQEQYDRILRTIGTHNIEDIHLNEDAIIDLIRIELYGLTAEDLLGELRERLSDGQ